MYQALYRKWRPRTFSDVCGQEHITKTLQNEIINERISHAYLFTGTRGTGKTSCAKILAKAVNCLNPVNGNPCNECAICKGIDNGSILDVNEIDAASNSRVEDIREIIDEVNFTPSSAKYRVYIVDEVHMLSVSAFNALLKTLEEPPSHVIFILATTDTHKLPVTILSRCQRFDFNRISSGAIMSRLAFIGEKEGFKIDDDASHLLAELSDGCMRDALTLLDRCLAYSDNITEATVIKTSGVAGSKHLFEFSDYISKNDIASCLTLITRLYNEACETDYLCRELINHFRNIMIAKTVKDSYELIGCSRADYDLLKERTKSFSLEFIFNCIDELEEAFQNMKSVSNKKSQLERAVIKICIFNNKQQAFQKENIPVQNTSAAQVIAPTAAVKNESSAPVNAPVEDLPEGPIRKWGDVIDNLLSFAPDIYSVSIGSTAVFSDNKIIIDTPNDMLYNMITSNADARINLRKAIFNITGSKAKLIINISGKNKFQNGNDTDDLAILKKKIDEFNA